MACFSLSQKFGNKLTQCVKRFWWSGSPEDAKSIGLMARSYVNQSGMGAWDFKIFTVSIYLSCLRVESDRIVTRLSFFHVIVSR